MRRLVSLIAVVVIMIPVKALAGEMVLSGNYYGNNLVVINPSFGNGFCVTEVLVNNKATQDEINSNSFEIDFSLLNFKTGDPITVIIRYHDGCIPKVVNPQALRGDQYFAFTFIKIDRSGRLNWSIKGDLGDDPFIIEQFRWNKWSQVGEVGVSDTLHGGMYSFEPVFHSGINQFRILRIDAYGNPVYSKVAKYNNLKNPPAELVSARVTEKIAFSLETMYELFDEKGNFLTSGFGKEIDITDLEKGKYFLNYDVKSAIITKK